VTERTAIPGPEPERPTFSESNDFAGPEGRSFKKLGLGGREQPAINNVQHEGEPTFRFPADQPQIDHRQEFQNKFQREIRHAWEETVARRCFDWQSIRKVGLGDPPRPKPVTSRWIGRRLVFYGPGCATLRRNASSSLRLSLRTIPSIDDSAIPA